MQQIFEAAGHSQHELQRTPTALYPQLPNISRKALSTLDGSPNKRMTLQSKNRLHPQDYRPESLCLSISLSRIVASAGEGLPHASDRSSGSWSDDSGYIVTTSRARGNSFTMSERVHDWLRALSSPDSQVSEGLNDQRPTTPDEYHVLDQTGSIGRCRTGSSQSRDLPRKNCMVMSEFSDPFVSDVEGQHSTTAFSLEAQGHDAMAVGHTIATKTPASHISDQRCSSQLHKHYTRFSRVPHEHSPPRSASVAKTRRAPLGNQILQEGGIQLSPLSPDVCIERGPSRYHNRKLQNTCDLRTPSRNRPAMTFQAPRLKENEILKELGNHKSDELFTPLGSRTGTRFRREQ
jgi:hypothetical protein